MGVRIVESVDNDFLRLNRAIGQPPVEFVRPGSKMQESLLNSKETDQNQRFRDKARELDLDESDDALDLVMDNLDLKRNEPSTSERQLEKDAE